MKDEIIAILILVCIIMLCGIIYLDLDREEKRLTIASQKEQILKMSHMLIKDKFLWPTKESIIKGADKCVPE